MPTLTSTDLIRLHGLAVAYDGGWPRATYQPPIAWHSEPTDWREAYMQQRDCSDHWQSHYQREQKTTEALRRELRRKRHDLWLGILIGAALGALVYAAERWLR